MGEQITLDKIIERLGNPGAMTPEEIKDNYLFLTSMYAQFAVELCDVMALTAQMEGEYVMEGMTSSKARTLTNASSEGMKAMKLKGRLKAIEEMLRSLKASQKYFLEDARNTV